MSARHFPSRSPVLPSGFPPRIHASGIPSRDSCFRNSDPGFAFRIHGSGFWPGPRILAGPPDSGRAPGFWLGPRILAGPPDSGRAPGTQPVFRRLPAVFPRLALLSRSLPAASQPPNGFSTASPGSFLSSLPGSTPAVLSAVPRRHQAASPAVPSSPSSSPGSSRRPHGSSPAAPGGTQAVPSPPRQFPRQFPQHSSRRPPGYLMSWRLTFLSEKEKVLPTPNSLRTVIRSPCASMMCLTMARPSPVPPCSRERPLSVR